MQIRQSAARRIIAAPDRAARTDAFIEGGSNGEGLFLQMAQRHRNWVRQFCVAGRLRNFSVSTSQTKVSSIHQEPSGASQET
jgi:hypothetical protein